MHNSNAHRNVCSFKEKAISTQTKCAFCVEDVLTMSPTCNACHGIKYCSTKCMADNA
jgi:hypothetical protein